jgi:hypothetical protein
MVAENPEPKIGAGHFGAMARLGLAELRAASVFSESNIVQPSPYGIAGTKTPGEVQEDREASAREATEPSGSVFDGRMGEPDLSSEREEREPPEPEKE